MKSRIFVHSDLDGVISAIILHKYLEGKYGKHDIEITYETYESININFAKLVDNQSEYQEILIGDISLNEELSKKCEPNVGIYDHHDTAKHLLTSGNPRFVYEPKMCGAAVCHKHLLGNKMTSEFKKLLGMTNTYDLWNIKKEDRLPLDLNVVVNYLKFTKSFERFYNGFDGFTPQEQEVIDSYWKIQDQMFQIVNKNHIGNPKAFNLIVVTENPEAGFFDMNYWAHHLMQEQGYKCVIIDRPTKNRWSVRLQKQYSDSIHLGFWLRDNMKTLNNDAGGHASAAGCSYKDMTPDEITDAIISLYYALDAI